MKEKLFVGEKVRRLRQQNGLRLDACARRIGVSTSYLSQIETNQRPVTARVMVELVKLFEVEPAMFDPGDGHRMVADVREASLDIARDGPPPSLGQIRQAVITSPALVQQFLTLHRAYRDLEQRLATLDETLGRDEATTAGAVLPYEEVRDYFHYRDNYIHSLDEAAEALSAELDLQSGKSLEVVLDRALADRFGVSVERTFEAAGALRRFDPARRIVHIDATQPPASRAFQLAYQLAAMAFGGLIEVELDQSGLHSEAARDVCRVGLTNYAAGALLLPYGRFREAAEAYRHDLERLQLRCQVSLEQVCHRLSNLQRPAQRGTPFYFVRVDMAGNITKRHSATRLQFARFGGACPLWNVHEAFAQPGEILTQVAETPDGARYLCMAVAVLKRGGAYHAGVRRYALGLGCEVEHAARVVYSDGLDISRQPVRIGVSCRICERSDCAQRAFPALDRPLQVTPGLREILPYRLAMSPGAAGTEG